MNLKKKLRVIIFEDDKHISFLLKNMIASIGYDVSTFPDPSSCTVYQNTTCNCSMDLPCADIVITDFNMPNMNGVELLKLQHDRGCAAQVENKAVMSAAITTQVKDEVDNLGCHFLEKPFKRADIKQWLEECAERIHSADGQH